MTSHDLKKSNDNFALKLVVSNDFGLNQKIHTNVKPKKKNRNMNEQHLLYSDCTSVTLKKMLCFFVNFQCLMLLMFNFIRGKSGNTNLRSNHFF